VVAGLQAGWAITQEKARAGWAVTQERAQAGWAVVQEQAHVGCLAAKERLDTALSGKALLDRGGRAAERAIRAKAATREAAARDAALAQSVASAAALLEDAAAQLREGRPPAEGLPDSLASLQDFEQLAEAYEARAGTYRRLLDGLLALPPAPEMSAAEQDAARILQLKDGCSLAAQRTVEGYAAIKERRCRSPCNNSQPWC